MSASMPQILGVGWDSDVPGQPSQAPPLLAPSWCLVVGALWESGWAGAGSRPVLRVLPPGLLCCGGGWRGCQK